jgi:hypothetical protein
MSINDDFPSMFIPATAISILILVVGMAIGHYFGARDTEKIAAKNPSCASYEGITGEFKWSKP